MKILSSLTRSRTKAAAAPRRAMLERVAGCTVHGWACLPGTTAEGETIELVLQEQQLQGLVVRRVERKDVAAVLRVPRVDLGFEIELPSSLWQLALPEAAVLKLRVNGEAVPGSLHLPYRSLDGAVEQALRLDDAECRDWLTQLRAHVETHELWHRLSEDNAGRLRAATLANPKVNPLQAHLERSDGLLWTGWVADPVGQPARIELLCNGQPVDCTVVRLERNDVAQTLGIERLDSGFSVEVPGHVWTHARDGSCELQLRCGGTPLHAQPVRLQLGDLENLVNKLRQELRNAEGVERTAAALRQDEQYTALLLVEHIAQAGAVARLSPDNAAWLRRIAAAFNLEAYLASPEAAIAPKRAALPASLPEEPAQDIGTLLIWRAMRKLNDLMADGTRDAIAAVDEVLGTLLGELTADGTRDPAAAIGNAMGTMVPGSLQQKFFLQATSLMCLTGHFEAFYRRVSPATVEECEQAEHPWQASVALPYLVYGGHVDRAANLLYRLPSMFGKGWLNTECIAETARFVSQAHMAGRLDSTILEKLVYGILAVIDGFKGNYWSRLPDQCLIESVRVLLLQQDHYNDYLRRDLVSAALRNYGLSPAFWESLQACGMLPSLDPDLVEGHRLFQKLRARLGSDEPLGLADLRQLQESLAFFECQCNPDVAMFTREIALAVAARVGKAGSADEHDTLLRILQGVNAGELTRIAAFPIVGGNPFARRVPNLAERLCELNQVPKNPLKRLQFRAGELMGTLGRQLRSLDRAGAEQTLAELERVLPGLCTARTQFVGFALQASVFALMRQAGMASLAPLVTLQFVLERALAETAKPEHMPSAVITGLGRLHIEQRRDPAPMLATFLTSARRRLRERFGAAFDSVFELPEGPALELQSTEAVHETLVAVYSCRRYLDTRVAAIRDTWIRQLQDAGIPYVIVVGDGDGRLHGDVLELDVSDQYEDLPQKTLRLLQWVYERTDFQHVLKIDDDCYLDVERYFGSLSHRKFHYYGRILQRNHGSFDRLWHQEKSQSMRGRFAVDKSPEPSTYCDGGGAYSVSRHGLCELVKAMKTLRGAALIRGSFMEDKLIGDLLALGGIAPANEDYEVLVRRRNFATAMPVNMWDNSFYPGRLSPTKVAHLDHHAAMAVAASKLDSLEVTPYKLWPTHARTLPNEHYGAMNQLELLSPCEKLGLIEAAPVVVVAVMRNEKVMLPHFLAHYRKLGASCFIVVDNLSTDGTRETLMEQPDVVLYSADTDYRNSHFGVTWQQAVLGNHCLGKWVLVADADELLVYDDCESQPLAALVNEAHTQGCDAVRLVMIDMYPEGELSQADLEQHEPFEVAACFDSRPLIAWNLGRGAFSNTTPVMSALRHRLAPEGDPALFTAQKFALFRYQPWVRLSEGLHFAAGLRPASFSACFAHFKYHAAFQEKVLAEVQRKQHFNDAEEYRKYLVLLSEAAGGFHAADVSSSYSGSHSFSALSSAC